MIYLTNDFYQISRDGIQWSIMATSFRCVRGYIHSAIEMSVSVQFRMNSYNVFWKDEVVKLADDLSCGADTICQPIDNVSRILAALKKC